MNFSIMNDFKWILECTYDSTWKGGKVVIGGASSADEMCDGHLWYYPKNDDFENCGSHYNPEKAMAELNITKYHYR